MGTADCQRCYLGNPCIGCGDYDEASGTCKSGGGCGREENEKCIRVVKSMAAVTEGVVLETLYGFNHM